MAFRTEEKLLKDLLKNSGLVAIAGVEGQETYYQIEPQGLFGVPDLVITRVEGNKLKETIAFELKLSNWKRALVQAYRYKSFANRSIVLMDSVHIKPALKYIESFRRSGVGLMSYDSSGELLTHYWPRYRRPFSPQLKAKYKSMVNQKMRRGPMGRSFHWLKLKFMGIDFPGVIPI